MSPVLSYAPPLLGRTTRFQWYFFTSRRRNHPMTRLRGEKSLWGIILHSVRLTHVLLMAYPHLSPHRLPPPIFSISAGDNLTPKWRYASMRSC